MKQTLRHRDEKWGIFIICYILISVFKGYNLKHHYAQKHDSKFNAYIGMCCKDKVVVLKEVYIQQRIVNNVTAQSESIVKASYIVRN